MDSFIDTICIAVTAVVFCLAVYFFLRLNGQVSGYMQEAIREKQTYEQEYKLIEVYPE